MPSRKGWLTPDAPVPSDTVCRRVLIPNDLQIIAAVNGALLELTKNYNWEQFGSASPEEVAAAMFAMYEGYVSEPCEGGEPCPRIRRVGAGGVIEESTDGGETWHEPTGDATIPPLEPRPEPTAAQRRCLAAANAANVLEQTYEGLIDAWVLDHSVEFGIGAFASILIGLIGNWLGIVSVAAINFAIGLFASVYEAIGNFLTDAWDAEFTDTLRCILYAASSDDNGVVTFDWSIASQMLWDMSVAEFDIEKSLLWAQLNYMLLFIGEQGLNAAGSTTGVQTADCNDCGTWVAEFPLGDFQTNVGGVVTLRLGTPGENGMVAAGSMPNCVNTNLPGWRLVEVGIEFQLPAGTTVEQMDFYFDGGNTDQWVKALRDEQCGAIMTWIGAFNNSPRTWIQTYLGWQKFRFVFYDNGGNTGNIRWLTKIRLSGTGVNPFPAYAL